MFIAICDDLAEERERIVRLLERWQSKRSTAVHIRTFEGGAALLEAAQKDRFSLYLLDIMMPGIDGIAAAREIRTFDEAAAIVFLTTSPGFAYESYGVQAMDYLLKPVEEARLWPLLDKLWLEEQRPEEGLTVKCGTTLVRVLFSQLSYVEVIGKHLYFHMADGTVHQVFGTMREWEGALLRRREFIRTHRSYIANLLQIAELSPAGAVTFSGQSLPVSRLLYSEVQEKYMKLLFAEREEGEG